MTKAVFVLVLLLAGCASEQQQPRWAWAKQGSTADDFETDHGCCTAQAFSPGNVNLLQAAIIQNSCMRGKGWRQVPQ